MLLNQLSSKVYKARNSIFSKPRQMPNFHFSSLDLIQCFFSTPLPITSLATAAWCETRVVYFCIVTYVKKRDWNFTKMEKCQASSVTDESQWNHNGKYEIIRELPSSAIFFGFLSSSQNFCHRNCFHSFFLSLIWPSFTQLY